MPGHGVGLLLQAERFDELCVCGGVFTLQILEQAATLCNLFDQTTAGAEVLAVCFQVLCELLDFRGQNGDLHLWGSSI